MADARINTTRGQLVRLGFRSGDIAVHDLNRIRAIADGLDEVLLTLLSAAADPDLALPAMATLLEADARTQSPGLAVALREDEHLAARLVAVLGSSVALGEWLARHPRHWRELVGSDPVLFPVATLRGHVLDALGVDPAAAAPTSSLHDVDAVDELRRVYTRLLLRLTADDLTAEPPPSGEPAEDRAETPAGLADGDAPVGWRLDETGAALAALAGATLEGALAIARARLGAAASSCRLAVIAMGKTGGGELNYLSDVDVVFAYEPSPDARGHEASRSATSLAAQLMQICSVHTSEGTIWQVDADLRPEGRSGPLVRTVASHLAYYERWAKTWEFQALLKARPVAGDVEVGQAYVQAMVPLVWEASRRDGFVVDVRAMRRRVIDHIPADVADRQLKLGPGGLRDVEFAVQLLQLVHGREDPGVRQRSTLEALAALTERGYVGREDGAALADSYRFLRSLEHRLQLFRMRRTAVLPTDEVELRRIGRGLGLGGDSAAALLERWRQHTREVRRLHEKLFYRPLLDAVAALPGSGLRLGPEAARARLAALGYADPRSALAHLEALTAGVSRGAAIQRQLLPAILSWLADGPDPDAGLLAFRKVSDSLQGSHWFLRRLRDEGEGAQQLATLLASSRFVTNLVVGAPDSVAMLGDATELSPRRRSTLTAEVRAVQRRQGDPREAVRAVRGMRRRELFRIGAADVLGLLDVDAVGEALSDIGVVSLGGALRAACRAVQAEVREPLPTRVAIVAMGRLGGRELSYASDVDVMFVHMPRRGAGEQEASRAATAVAQELRRSLALPGDDPPLLVDAGLRPEGKDGPLVRTLASYAAYYARWSSVWEAQALLRADPLIGDPEVCSRFRALIDPIRWPANGLRQDGALEVRRIKARMEAERLPRGADPALNVKLGRGGLADVEWTVQLLQLQHAGQVPGLRTPRTLSALTAAVDAGLLDATDGAALIDAWRFASRVRNAVVLVRGRAGDALPADSIARAGVAQLLGYPQDSAGRLVEDYLRTARHARSVMDRIFWA
jgi:glutamate-ammonia-ligase adenylyltransferase